MSARRVGAGASAVITLLVILAITASNVLADACCGTASVTFHPSSAAPGEHVRVDGISCVDPAGGPPFPLAFLGPYWLTTQSVAAVTNDPSALDATHWASFASVSDKKATVGSATIVIPALPPGAYILWWACKGGPTVDHPNLYEYSTGPQLVIDLAATDTVAPTTANHAGGPLAVLLGIVAFAAALWWTGQRRRRAGRR